jgi:hypothetical protein
MAGLVQKISFSSTYALLMVLSALCSAAVGNDRPISLALENDYLRMEVTPDFGGRVLSFSLKDHPNILKLGEPVTTQPEPRVNARAEAIGYLGHTVWVGPQSEWWTHQTLNPERKTAEANWPPDPFLVLARNEVVQSAASGVLLQGVPSPISGLQLRKTFNLIEDTNNGVELTVQASNIRNEAVAWDLWFNTRMEPSTRVYVPVASMKDVRVEHWESEIYGPLKYSWIDGLFSLDLVEPPKPKSGRHGKAFIQPSAGWMSGFSKGQLLIITFPLQPREKIHPEQGQVELYLNYLPKSDSAGLLEMEVHSSYQKLAPGELMEAREFWYLFSYGGPDDKAAQMEFLKEQIEKLRLD